MVASKAAIVVFTILFMGFISLLLIFNIYSTVHDSTQVTEQESELAHQELVFDLDSTVNTSCPLCENRSLKSITCSNDSFVLVIGVQGAKVNEITGDEVYYVLLTAEMKSSPLVWKSLSSMEIHTETVPLFQGVCSVQLIQGREYFVTGTIDQVTLVPKLSPCDLILDWSRLQTANRHRIFAAFNSLRC